MYYTWADVVKMGFIYTFIYVIVEAIIKFFISILFKRKALFVSVKQKL